MAAFARNLILILFFVVLAGCSTISPFNQYAYEQATGLKVDALALVDKSTEPYAQHAAEVADLETRCRKAYEYADGLANNQDTANQWKIITDPDGGSLFAYFELWRSEGQVRPAAVKDAEQQLAQHFNQIIQLESGKIKPHP
jgi:hypothetical protein